MSSKASRPVGQQRSWVQWTPFRFPIGPESVLTMHPSIIERAARELYVSVGFSDEEPARMLDLARKVLGPGSVLTVPAAALPSDASLVTMQGHRRIYLRSGLTPERQRFAVAHELGHHVLNVDSSTRENEAACDAFAAALVAPHAAFLRALSESTPSFAKLARWFLCSETCSALRFGEVTGAPVALVSPAAVRIRGEPFEWPNEALLRGSGRPKGVARARLSDDRRRFALTAANRVA